MLRKKKAEKIDDNVFAIVPVVSRDLPLACERLCPSQWNTAGECSHPTLL
jgi:hypothetical protein